MGEHAKKFEWKNSCSVLIIFYLGTVQFGRDLEWPHSKIDGVLKISPYGHLIHSIAKSSVRIAVINFTITQGIIPLDSPSDYLVGYPTEGNI